MNFIRNLYDILKKKETYALIIIVIALTYFLIPSKETLQIKEIIVEKKVEVEKIVYKEVEKKVIDTNKRKFKKVIEKPDGTKITKEYEKEITNEREEKNIDYNKDTVKTEESNRSTEVIHTKEKGVSTFTTVLVSFIIGLAIGIPLF